MFVLPQLKQKLLPHVRGGYQLVLFLKLTIIRFGARFRCRMHLLLSHSGWRRGRLPLSDRTLGTCDGHRCSGGGGHLIVASAALWGGC